MTRTNETPAARISAPAGEVRSLSISHGDARAAIRELAARTLVDTGALGTVPTPVDLVLRETGIRERIDLRHVDPRFVRELVPGTRAVLGVLVFDLATVLVDEGLAPARRRFTIAHEVGHWLLPGHREGALFRVDTEQTIDGHDPRRMEMEANIFAAELLFQAHTFERNLSGKPADLETAFDLADGYGASRHATLQHLAACSREAVAFAVAGPPSSAGSIGWWYTVESASFLARFGTLGAAFAAEAASLRRGVEERLGATRRVRNQPQTRRMRMTELNGRRTALICEAVFTGYAHLVLVTASHPYITSAPERFVRAIVGAPRTLDA